MPTMVSPLRPKYPLLLAGKGMKQNEVHERNAIPYVRVGYAAFPHHTRQSR
jgi:hypothetical protein